MLALLLRSRVKRMKRSTDGYERITGNVYSGMGPMRPGDIIPHRVPKEAFLAMRTLENPAGKTVKRVKVNQVQ